MNNKAKKIILCLLEIIKYKVDLKPKKTLPDAKWSSEWSGKLALEKYLKNNRKEGIVESTARQLNSHFDSIYRKNIGLYRNDLRECYYKYAADSEAINSILLKLKEEGIIREFIETKIKKESDDGIYNYYVDCIKIGLPDDFEDKYKKYKEYLQDRSSKEKELSDLVGNIDEKSVKEKKGKIEVCFSDDDGFYVEDEKGSYPIKGKRSKLVKSLRDGKKDGNILANLYSNNNLQQLSKDIGEINENFRNKLKLEYDIIVNVPTGGYKINKEKYQLKFTGD